MSKFFSLVALSVLLAGCASGPVTVEEIVSEAPEVVVAEPKPEVTPEPEEYTTSEKLAAVDDRWGDRDLYAKRFEQVVERCPNTEESALGDTLYKATVLLDDRGITEDSLWSMETLLNAIAPSEAGTLDCREVLTLAVILRIEEG
jgi:hypothetical protein